MSIVAVDTATDLNGLSMSIDGKYLQIFAFFDQDFRNGVY